MPTHGTTPSSKDLTWLSRDLDFDLVCPDTPGLLKGGACSNPARRRPFRLWRALACGKGRI
jgi:hypothetical protein